MDPVGTDDFGPVLDVCGAILDDAAGHRLRPLEDYLARVPEYAATIAECWRNAGGEGVAATDATAEKPSEFRIGPYAIRGVLGRGGQGVVYAAVDTRLGRGVALKVLDGAIAFSKESIRRFRAEARNTARLEHPGICTLYDAGIHEGRPFLAMRRIEGATLAERIRRRFAVDAPPATSADRARGGSAAEPVPPTLPQRIAIVVLVVEKVARALGFAHGLGVVHHDVKPGNIIIDRAGDPVLVDFGVAKSVEDETRSMTRSLAVTGTLPYLAPELLDPATSFVGPAADLWSLGVVLYEALTLRRPFEALTAEGMREAIREGRRRRLGQGEGGMPPDLEAIVDKALAPDPRFRYQSALDLAEDLRRFRAREPVLARRPSRSRRVVRWAARNRAAAALMVVLSVIVAAVAAWTLIPGRVSVASSPGGAAIFVDGVDSGRVTPALVRIWPFRRAEIELRLPGHRHDRVASTGLRFATEQLGPIALVPETGRLRITTAQAGLSAVLRRRGAAAPGREEVRLALSGDDVVTLEAGGWDLAATGKNLADRRWTVEVPERGDATHNVSLARLRTRPEIRVSGEVPFRVDAGDFDGDGHEDLLLHHRASSGPSRVEVVSGWTSEPLWSRALGNEDSSIVGLIDANGDGLPEVCCVEHFGRRRVLLLSGRTGRSFGELPCAAEVAGARIVPGEGPSAARVLLWSVESPGAAGSTPIVHFQLFDPATRVSAWSWALSSAPPVVVRTEDLDGDGTKEICAGLPDGQIAVLETGTPGRARFFRAGPGELVGFAVVGDRDGDGIRDVVVAMRGTAPSPTGDAVESIRFEIVGRNRTEPLWSWSAPTTPNEVIRIEFLIGCDAGERSVRIVTACEWRPTADQRAYEVYEVEAGDGGSPAKARRLARFGAWLSSTQLDLDGDGRKELAFLGGPESRGSRIADRAVLTVVPSTGDRAPRSRELPGIAAGVLGSRATLEGRRRDLVLLTTSLAESRTLLAEIWSGTRLLEAESAQWQGWIAGTKDAVWSCPASVDVDRDGWLDVVIGGHDGFVRALSGKDGAELWHFGTGCSVWASPAVGPIDGDAVADVVVASDNGSIVALSGSDGQPLWTTSFAAERGGSASALLIDLGGDGRLDVVAGTRNGRLHALDGRTGRELWSFDPASRKSPHGSGNSAGFLSRPAAADLDGDGREEIVAASLGGLVVILDQGGRVVNERWLEGPVGADLLIEDLDRDGRPELVVGMRSGWLEVLRLPELETMWPRKFDRAIDATPSIADLDHCGARDLVVAAQDFVVRALSGDDGRELWRFVVGSRLWSSPKLAELDGDGILDVVIGSNGGTVFVLSGADGRLLQTLDPGGEINGGSWLGDLDGNGEPDLVVPSFDARIYTMPLDAASCRSVRAAQNHGAVARRFAAHGGWSSVLAEASAAGEDPALAGIRALALALTGRPGEAVQVCRAGFAAGSRSSELAAVLLATAGGSLASAEVDAIVESAALEPAAFVRRLVFDLYPSLTETWDAVLPSLRLLSERVEHRFRDAGALRRILDLLLDLPPRPITALDLATDAASVDEILILDVLARLSAGTATEDEVSGIRQAVRTGGGFRFLELWPMESAELRSRLRLPPDPASPRER